MKKITGALLILTVLASLFSDIIPGLTPILIVIYISVCILEMAKNIKKITLDKYHIMIFINIVILLFITLNNQSIGNVKFILYFLSIIFIKENSTKEDIKVFFNILNIITFIISIYIIIIGRNFDTSVLDFINVRSDLIIQKQSYNAILTIIMPYVFFQIFKNKKKIYLIPLTSYLISGLVVLQIKTLIVTLPLTYLIILLIKGRIKRKKIVISVIGFIFGGILVYKYNLIPQLTPIIDYIINGEGSIYVGSKYLVTYLMRREIFINCFNIIKDNLIFGVGYGNYYKYVAGQVFYVVEKRQYVDLPKVTECGFLSFIVEGGLLSFSAIIIFLLNMFSDIKKIMSSNCDFIEEVTIFAFISFVISNFIQDNLNFTFWFLIGIVLSIITYKRRYAYEDIDC